MPVANSTENSNTTVYTLLKKVRIDVVLPSVLPCVLRAIRTARTRDGDADERPGHRDADADAGTIWPSGTPRPRSHHLYKCDEQPSSSSL